MSARPRLFLTDSRRHAVVEADLLDDLAVDYLQHRGAGEAHLASGRGGEGANQKTIEGRPRMGAATFPSTDDVVALGDQICGAPEIEIRERRTEIGHERLDVFSAAAGFVQRIFEQHVGRGNLVDDREIDVLTPEVGKPAADDGLIVCFLAY